MSIPKNVARQLIGLSQLALSNMEIGELLNAKCSLLRLAAIIRVETDQADEIEKWRPVGI
jgi:hypothetical protein